MRARSISIGGIMAVWGAAVGSIRGSEAGIDGVEAIEAIRRRF